VRWVGATGGRGGSNVGVDVVAVGVVGVPAIGGPGWRGGWKSVMVGSFERWG
jgi:hypothetical protein